MSDLKKFNQTIMDVRTQNYLESVLGKKKEEFVNNVTSLVANNKMLQDCEPMTLMYASMKATTLGLPLDPNLGFAYVLPYKNNKAGTTEAQLQFGYKAYMQFAARGGEVARINVTDVREGEIKGRDRRTGELNIEWIEDDAIREKAKVVGYLGYVKLRYGYEKESYWTIPELESHGKRYSQTYKNGFGVWKDNFDAMARKTVLKLMLNKGDIPMSATMASLATYDQAVIRDESMAPNYADNTKPDSATQAAAFIEAEEVHDEAEKEAQK